MNAPATSIANQSARTTGHNGNTTLTTTANSAARQLAAFSTRVRPPAPELELAWTAPEPAPSPTPRPVKPAPSDPTAAVVRAFITGPDPNKTTSEIVEMTGLSRGTVCSTIAALAAAEHVTRQMSDVGPYIIVRWSLRR